MVKFSLHSDFIKDSFATLRQRGLKKLISGETAVLSQQEKKWLEQIKDESISRSGKLQKIDVVHGGRGTALLAPHPTETASSILVLYDGIKITNGPDLWLYLSTSSNPKKSFESYKNLGLLKGNKGDQLYKINKPYSSLKQYKSVIIYCKQFDILFSYALISKISTDAS